MNKELIKDFIGFVLIFLLVILAFFVWGIVYATTVGTIRY